MGLHVFTSIAYAAIAIFVAVLAVFLAVKLLGKIAKFVIVAVIIAAVLWFLFSENSILREITSLRNSLPTLGDIFQKGG